MDGQAMTGGMMAEMSDSAWRARLEELGDEQGYFEPLGRGHSAFFSDEGPVLIVSFETRAAIRAREGQMPLGYDIAREAGHSSLTLIADEDSWFRDPAIYAYFDRLVDEAFFEDFDRVVFYGAGPGCGYAAAAYAVAAPGATLIAVQPQATLDPRVTGWDDRFRAHRRMNFTDRYGVAPQMVEGLGRAFVIFDPAQTADAMHAALFARAPVELLQCRYLGADIARLLTEMNVLDAMLEAAAAGEFDAATFWSLYRARRNHRRHLWTLAGQCNARGRPWLEAMLCRNVLARMSGPRFRNRLTQLEEQLAAEGRPLPETV